MCDAALAFRTARQPHALGPVSAHMQPQQCTYCMALTEEGRWCGKAKNPAPPIFRCEHASQPPDLYAVIFASACAAAAFDSMSALAHPPCQSLTS